MFTRTMLVLALAMSVSILTSSAWAVGRCKAVAGIDPDIVLAPNIALALATTDGAKFHLAQSVKPLVPYKPKNVTIQYIAHSTFLITTEQAVTIATDYAGFSGPVSVPEVVTMNNAHSTHWTAHPDPKIKHVLRGWAQNGKAARYERKVRDVNIRNVPTNIRNFIGATEENGNSIFIFEVANLCIGHVGHLHHTLNDKHLAQIGQLDIVMVPVDGSMTLDTSGMIEVVKKLRARVVLPMHWFSGFGLEAFLAKAQKDFAVKRPLASVQQFSTKTMPKEPTVIVLTPGHEAEE